MKTYLLKPTMTFKTVADCASDLKPRDKDCSQISNLIAPQSKPKPSASIPGPIPPRQPLPAPAIDPDKTAIKLGLDVHLAFIMAVVQRGHAAHHPPRRFSPQQLADQVRKWIAQGFQVFCVQESCGFGFTLHRLLVEAGAQSFLITPVPLNGRRKTDKLDARALCQRLTRFLDGERNELSPIRVPTIDEQQRREWLLSKRTLFRRQTPDRFHRSHGQWTCARDPG